MSFFKTKNNALAIIFMLGSMALCIVTYTKQPLQYGNVTFTNNTTSPISIGYHYKSGQHSPSSYVGSGTIQPQESKTIDIRVNLQNTASYPNKSATYLFTPTAGDKWTFVGNGTNSLRVNKQ